MPNNRIDAIRKSNIDYDILDKTSVQLSGAQEIFSDVVTDL